MAFAKKLKVSPLKVIHVCFSQSGQPGRAAYRIHKALLKNGVNSSFLTVADVETEAKKHKSEKGPLRTTTLKKLGWFFNQNNPVVSISNSYRKINSKLTCEYSSLPFSEVNVLENPRVIDADIIHLHWVAGLLDYPSFFRQNKKPVLWTLHDMNPFQGIFHYKEDEIINKPKTGKLDQRVRLLKYKAIQNRTGNLSIVTPSKWLLSEVKRSKVFKNAESSCIPYPISFSDFFPENKQDFKKANHIPEDNTVFLFVADFLRKNRKGFDLLLEAFNKASSFPITLLVVGNSEGFEVEGIDIRFIGNVTENSVLRKFYSGADAVVIPSREDNLPNVMLESLACGTPVLSFAVGGFNDHIQEFKTGLKADHISADSLFSIIEKFILNKEQFNRFEIFEYAKENFSEQLIAEKYMNLYNKISGGLS